MRQIERLLVVRAQAPFDDGLVGEGDEVIELVRQVERLLLLLLLLAAAVVVSPAAESVKLVNLAR